MALCLGPNVKSGRGLISRDQKVIGVLSSLRITVSREECEMRGIATPVPRDDDMINACKRSVKIEASQF